MNFEPQGFLSILLNLMAVGAHQLFLMIKIRFLTTQGNFLVFYAIEGKSEKLGCTKKKAPKKKAQRKSTKKKGATTVTSEIFYL